MTIPFNKVSTITPSILSAGGSAIDMNALLLTTASDVPYGEILTFASKAAVSAYFGGSADETSIASIYFKGPSIATRAPGSLLVARYPLAAISAFLRSASLADLTLADVQGVHSGSMSITVGGVVKTSATIDLAAATSFSNAASIIQAAFTSPGFTVTYDSQHSAFVFTTTATGTGATLTYGTGNLFVTFFKLTEATGAVLSQGAAAGVPATFMDAQLLLSQNWATFMTVWEPDLENKQAFADWSNSLAPRWLYVAADSDTGALTPDNTATFGGYCKANSLTGVLPIYGDFTHSALACSWAASLDFTRFNGRSTLCFRMQSGIEASVTDETDYDAILSNGYNCYGAFGGNNPANNQSWFTPGSVSGEWTWADTYVDQIWLNANLQLAFVNLLTSIGSIPYNAAGQSIIYAAALGPINAALNFGAIRTGVSLSTTQKAEIQAALGFDASKTIESAGFVLQILPASAEVRAARTTPPVTLYYQDGGSVQQINMASIAIQ